LLICLIYMWTHIIKVVAGLVFVGIIIISFYAFVPSAEKTAQTMSDTKRMELIIAAKTNGALMITKEMSSIGPAGFFLGLGPGNSISRVALMPHYARGDSSVGVLQLQSKPFTYRVWREHPQSTRSSLYTGVSSWLGIFGDWGLAGLCVFLGMIWAIFRQLKGQENWEAVTAKAVLVMAALAGGMFSWLEEPPFTLMVAGIVGLALRASAEKSKAYGTA